MRLGIFGGTFDPPHLGHLILASEAHAQLGLERVLWVVTGQSPFKQEQRLSPADVRLAMVQAAIEGNATFALSTVDLDRPPPHYTADTLALLKGQHPSAQLFFIMGADLLHELPDWRRARDVLAQCELGVLRRPGTVVDLSVLEVRLPGVSEKVHWVDAPQLEIAARDIRRRVRAGISVRYLVPDAVVEIMEARRLYHANVGGEKSEK